ncbi:unnamed protein product [Calypogeia fissa]
MGSQFNQVFAALERERMERDKRARQNLSKRKCQLGKDQRDTAYHRLFVEAKEQCENLILSAENEAASIVKNARNEAAEVLDKQNKECAQLIERRDALRQRLMRHKASLERLQRNEDPSSECVPLDPDAAEEFRRRDATRKKAQYWKEKGECHEEPGAEDAPCDDAADPLPNRKRRSVTYTVYWAAKTVMSKLECFNDKAKKLFFKKFWMHRSLKRFQPLGFGTSASVGAAIVDLKESLHLVKPAKRKDHLATKQALLTAMVGRSIVGNRYQTALARALGIKRQNLHKASKVRKLIHADQSVKYSMGEQKDALGGHIKQGIQREQLKGIDGQLLENAHDVVKFCEQKFALGQEKEYGDVQLVRRLFWEIPVGAVDRTKKWDCDPVKGVRSLHCFDGFSNKMSTLLRVRELCCFCPHCLDDDYEACENKAWVGRFKLEMIKGVLPADVRQEVIEMGVGEGGNDCEDGSLGSLVQVGEFYAVEAALPNKWNATFYIMQCEEAVHEVKKDFVDGYDQAFRKGDKVVKGLAQGASPSWDSDLLFQRTMSSNQLVQITWLEKFVQMGAEITAPTPIPTTTGLGGFDIPRSKKVTLRSDSSAALNVGVLHFVPSLEPFPLLADPKGYEPNAVDLSDHSERQYWFNILSDNMPDLVDKAVASEGATDDSVYHPEMLLDVLLEKRLPVLDLLISLVGIYN